MSSHEKEDRKRPAILAKLGVLLGANPGTLERVRKGEADLKALTPQVKGVNLLFASRFRASEYWASPKADGVRTVLFGTKDREVFAVGSGLEKLSESPFARAEFPFAVDSELLESGRYLVFDVLGLGDRSWLQKSYGERLQKLREMTPRSPAELKRVVRASKLNALMSEDPGYLVDGVILTENRSGLAHKWKPRSQLTVDFLAKDGKLFVGDSEKRGDPLRATEFSPKFLSGDDAQKHGFPESVEARVVECCWSGKSGGEWKLVRVREDRAEEVKTGSYFGNHRYVADKIWFEIHYPVPLSWLEGGPSPYKRMGRFDDRVDLKDFEKHESLLVVSGTYVSRNPSLRRVRNLYVLAPDPYEVAAFLERPNNLRFIAVARTPGAKLLLDAAKKARAAHCINDRTTGQIADMDAFL